MTDASKLHVRVNGKELVSYQAKPLSNPRGGDTFAGSDFIHPLKTPSGFIVTDIQPDDHLHHFGLWWPWKYLETEGRKVLCWELQEGDGLIQAQDGNLTPDGFTAKSVYVDRRCPDGPRTLLDETVTVRLSQVVDTPTRGYHLDVEVIHEVATGRPITVLVNRYSGFTLRGTSHWDSRNSSILTSEGRDRDNSNCSRAKWVRVEGDAKDGNTAGVLLMSRTDNHDHPELLRTWDTGTNNGAIFINFNPVQEKSWVFEPGEQYTRDFRAFVYDGTLSPEDAEKMWKHYIRTTVSTTINEPVADGSI